MARGCQQRILADFTAMSMPAEETSPPHPSLSAARPAMPAAGASPAHAPLPGGARTRELGGPPGPEPTRFGDWEKHGRCIDF
jgi:hypothetical protein